MGVIGSAYSWWELAILYGANGVLVVIAILFAILAFVTITDKKSNLHRKPKVYIYYLTAFFLSLSLLHCSG
jgi:hypothetical protein